MTFNIKYKGPSPISEMEFVTRGGIEIPVSDLWIWELYNFKCIICVYQPAVCLHEVPPKSKNPRWREMPETRFPVCNQHHEKLHVMNWKAAQAMVINQRNAYFPQVLERIEQHKIEEMNGRTGSK